MPQLPDAPRSLWRSDPPPPRPPLDGPADVDVAVVGAGITGLATAVLAARAGRRVLVLEDQGIARGGQATTLSTAKVTVQHGIRYSVLARRHGPDVARRYGEAQTAGLEWIRQRWPDLEPRTALTYATDDESRRKVEEEVAAMVAAGLPAELVEDLDVPFPTRGAVAVRDQGQMDPGPFLAALADEVESLGGRVVEGTRATGIDDGRRGATVRTAGGDVRARWVVLGTGLPFLDRSLLFARAEPKSSYCIAVRTGGRLPEEMLLSASEPVRSLRTAPDPEREGERVLVIGGSGHKTGGPGSTRACYQSLLDWTTEHFAVEDVPWRWSTEDFVPTDLLPFVGPVWPLPTRVLVATGYAKWGFTNGVAAAMALVARMTGGREYEPAWADDWSTHRSGLVHGAKELLGANGNVAKELAKGWGPRLAKGDVRPTVTVPSGPEAGRRVSAVCTHIGGIVRWNDGDGCWDCPLHGSKFEADGTLLHGPAVKDLAEREGSRP